MEERLKPANGSLSGQTCAEVHDQAYAFFSTENGKNIFNYFVMKLTTDQHDLRGVYIAGGSEMINKNLCKKVRKDVVWDLIRSENSVNHKLAGLNFDVGFTMDTSYGTEHGEQVQYTGWLANLDKLLTVNPHLQLSPSVYGADCGADSDGELDDAMLIVADKSTLIFVNNNYTILNYKEHGVTIEAKEVVKKRTESNMSCLWTAEQLAEIRTKYRMFFEQAQTKFDRVIFVHGEKSNEMNGPDPANHIISDPEAFDKQTDLVRDVAVGMGVIVLPYGLFIKGLGCNQDGADRFRIPYDHWHSHEDKDTETTFLMAWELALVTWSNFAYFCGPDILLKTHLKKMRYEFGPGADDGAEGPNPSVASPPVIVSSDKPPLICTYGAMRGNDVAVLNAKQMVTLLESMIVLMRAEDMRIYISPNPQPEGSSYEGLYFVGAFFHRFSGVLPQYDKAWAEFAKQAYALERDWTILRRSKLMSLSESNSTYGDIPVQPGYAFQFEDAPTYMENGNHVTLGHMPLELAEMVKEEFEKHLGRLRSAPVAMQFKSNLGYNNKWGPEQDPESNLSYIMTAQKRTVEEDGIKNAPNHFPYFKIVTRVWVQVRLLWNERNYYDPNVSGGDSPALDMLKNFGIEQYKDNLHLSIVISWDGSRQSMQGCIRFLGQVITKGILAYNAAREVLSLPLVVREYINLGMMRRTAGEPIHEMERYRRLWAIDEQSASSIWLNGPEDTDGDDNSLAVRDLPLSNELPCHPHHPRRQVSSSMVEGSTQRR